MRAVFAYSPTYLPAYESRFSNTPLMPNPLPHRSIGIFVFGMATLVTLLVVGTYAGMKLARHRAYADIVASCAKVAVFTLNGASYVCAPIAHIERPARPADPASQPAVGEVIAL